MIKNLSQLKRELKNNPRLEITGHFRKEYIGQIRRVTLANTVCFYSTVENQPDHKINSGNGGKGSVLYWKNAPFWDFRDGVCSIYLNKEHTEANLVMAFRLLDDVT